MDLEEERARCSYSFGFGTSRPNECLLNSEGSRIIFLEEFNKISKANLKIYIHLFYTYHLGELEGHQTSEGFKIASAWEKWHQLHQKGWTDVPHEYG